MLVEARQAGRRHVLNPRGLLHTLQHNTVRMTVSNACTHTQTTSLFFVTPKGLN